MKQKTIITIWLSAFALAIAGCNNSNNVNNVPNYTPAGSGDTNSSGGIRSSVHGEEIFRQRCQACHGLNGNYRNNNAADLQLSRLDSIGIVNTIINGRGAMPMFKGTLSDADLAQLELYVKTLRK